MISSTGSIVAAAAAVSRRRETSSPDLRHFREQYPLTVANFGALADREAWLRRIWETEARWRREIEQACGRAAAEEVVVRGAPPAGLQAEGSFDVIYAGGVSGLLHAAVLACRYQKRVLVFDPHLIGKTERGWNISEEDLRELERVGLFTKEEVGRAVVNRYDAGVVKFHDAASRIKARPLVVRGVLDVALDADRLLALAVSKIREHGPAGCALMEGLRFVRAYVEPHRVSVETEDARGRRRLFESRLFVDAQGANSAVARQLNGGRAMTHVCPTVGTVARGFARGPGEAGKIDFKVGEILVSTEDASEHRQLIWEGLGGSPQRDEYATYLFFYDSVSSPADKSLLALYERYFASLSNYKQRGAQWRVARPVFGYVPSFRQKGWGGRRRTAADRVLVVGGVQGLAGPLTLCGFGAHARGLRAATHLTSLALDADLLDAAALSEITSCEPRAAQAAGLAEFLRPAGNGAPPAVNETLNALMAALHYLDDRVRRDLFQDRLSFGALKSLLATTARLYPRIFQRVREHLGARGALWWLAGVAEAFLSERRERAAADAHSAAAGAEDAGADAAENFARRLALYKKEAGACDDE